ncbi:MAG TPA: nuclear transport factor 2 family protein [Gammaproteobacteria bacterium]|nr:nuclear transport factor 2 family protein [Gammaproteobacteria bacterium]
MPKLPRTALCAPVIAIIVTVAGGCAHRAPAPAAPDAARLEQRQSDFLEALTAKDPDQVAAHFAEDAVIHIANLPPIQGREAIRQLYRNIFRFLRASSYTPEVLRLAGSGDMAYSAGGVTTAFDGEQGLAEYPGKYLLIWERRDGDWSIVAYSISNNQAD